MEFEALTLNTWYNRQGKELLDFLDQQSKRVAVFCFQEVMSGVSGELPGGYKTDSYAELAEVLSAYRGYFSETTQGLDPYGQTYNPDLRCGNAMFVRNGVVVPKWFISPFINGDHSKFTMALDGVFNCPSRLQYLKTLIGWSEISIGNVHGIPHPGDKEDTPDRETQITKIISIANSDQHPVIIMGDFNLNRDTKSVKKFREVGFRDLIDEYNIVTTRTRLNKPYYGTPQEQLHADYVFVRGVIVKNFQALDVEVSDHRPLLLTCLL